MASVKDEIYFEAIETVLWSYATFSFHPGCELLNKLTHRIEGHLSLYSALHLANLVWCYALFDSCTAEIWNAVVEVFMRYPLQSVQAEALFRLFQTYLLKSNKSGDAFDLPRDIKQAGMNLWTMQMNNNKDIKSPFHIDVARSLEDLGLNIRIFQHFCIGDEPICICFYIECLHRGLELIAEHEFTINTTEPIGSAIMRTKIIQMALSNASNAFPIDFIKFTEWKALRSDEDKRRFLKRLLKIELM